MCEHQLSLLPKGSQISNSCLQGWQPGPLPSKLTCQPETTVVGPRYGRISSFLRVFPLTTLVITTILQDWKHSGLGGWERAGLSPAERSALHRQRARLFCLLSIVHDCFFTSWAVWPFPLHWGLRILTVGYWVVGLNPAVHLPTALSCGDTLCCCQDPSSVLLGWTILVMPEYFCCNVHSSFSDLD